MLDQFTDLLEAAIDAMDDIISITILFVPLMFLVGLGSMMIVWKGRYDRYLPDPRSGRPVFSFIALTITSSIVAAILYYCIFTALVFTYVIIVMRDFTF